MSLAIPFTLPVAGLWQAYANSNMMGKIIVIVQMVLSIIVWSVMLGKYVELRGIDNMARYFRKLFTKSPMLLDLYFQRKRANNPLVMIYHMACEKLVSLLSPGAVATSTGIEGRRLSAGKIEIVKGVAEEALSDRLIVVDSQMWLLAIGSSLAPLIGLLGTVWGILDAFQSMGAKGSALLSDVAPGLSSALLTTVVGLCVAIPSAAGYNFLLEKTRRIGTYLDGFTDEFLGRLKDEFSEESR